MWYNLGMNYGIVDLHLHLDGSLLPSSVLKVAKREGIELPASSLKKIKKFLQVDSDCKSLNDYLTKFDLPNLVLQSKTGIYTCTIDLLESLAKSGLKYAEIRMAPQLSTAGGLTQQQVVETLIKASKDGEKYGIYSNIILCMMRGNNTKRENLESIEVAKKHLNKGVVAMDLAGAEALFPNEMFDEEFKLINKFNIPLTIHAGEASGANSVMSALKYNPKRIGHGIHSINDESVIQELKTRNIYLEICPKSNLDTKTISSYEELPIRKFIEKGIKVTINTDDMTVSNTTLKQEYKTLKNMGFNEKELQEFARNSIEASFASDEIKQKLFDFIK